MAYAAVREANPEVSGAGFDPAAQKARFRAYDPRLNVMLQIFDDLDKTMLQHKIFGHYLLKIELEPFEEYNSDWKYVKVIDWADVALRAQDEEQAFDLAAIGEMPYKLLKLNYETDKVEDLER